MKQFKMNERQRFSIRKFSIGAASVLLGSVFFVANPATEVQASEANTEVVAQDRDVKPDNSSALNTLEPSSQNPSVGQAGTEAETQGTEKKEPGTPSKDGEGEVKVEETSTESNSKLESNKEIAAKQDQPKTDVELSRQLNTQNLESLLSEIDTIKTENYTEESVAALKAKAEEARQVLATAQNQTEVDAAFRTLVSYKNTGLKRVKKDVEPKAPKVDTTNGKVTVGLKAENTEPNGTNIAGRNHSLNGTSMPEGSGFRTTPEETSGIEFGISNNRTDGNYSSIDKYFYEILSNQVRTIIKFVSKTGEIKNVTVTSNTGKSVTVEKMTNFPNNATTYFARAITDVNGKNDAVLTFTVKTAGGDKTVQIGAFRSLSKPTIKVPTGQTESTVDAYLKGKDGTKPTIDVEVPSVPSLPSYAKMKVYLVADNDRDKTVYAGDEFATNGNPRPTRLTAKVDVSTGTVDPVTKKTTVTIRESDYLKPLSGGKLLALTVIEIDNQTNGNPGIRASSYSDAVTVAPKVNLEELKTNAIAEIAKAAEEEIKAIKADVSLTSTEKTTKENDVTAKKTAGETAINSADTADKVASEKDKAKTAIEGVHTPGNLAEVKRTAIAEIAKAAEEEIKAIKADVSLTSTEKTTKENDVTAKKTAGETAINSADTADKVASEKDKAKTAIEGVHTPGNLAEVKRTAIAEILDLLHLKNANVDSNNDLTTEEKANVKNQYKNVADAANNSINKSEDADKVLANKEQGINAINAVVILAETEKSKAIKAIETAAFAKKTEISNRFDLITEDKSRALQQVDQEAKDAKIAVDKGVTNKDVEQAKVAGIDAIKNINPQPSPRPLPTPQPQPSTPTQPDQGATETPTSPSEPAPQPSQPTAPSQPASPAPAPSSAPPQAPRVAASPSASSTSTQAPAQEQVDKSELRALTQELDQRLKALATVSDSKIDAAKAVLLDAQKALEDSALTEQGLRTAVASVKAALNSLKDVKANASDSKPAQDKKDTKQGTEDSKDSDKMTETNSVPAGVIVVSLLALLGVIAFWLVRRKKESEIQQLSTELTKVLGQLDAEKADKKVLAKAQKLLQETLDFVKEENGSAETEAKLVEELKATLAKLK